MFSGSRCVRQELKRSTSLHSQARARALCSVASVDPAGCEATQGYTVRPCLEGPRKHVDRKEEGRVEQLACGQVELNKMGSRVS